MDKIPFVHVLDLQNTHFLGYTESYSDTFNIVMQEKKTPIHS